MGRSNSVVFTLVATLLADFDDCFALGLIGADSNLQVPPVHQVATRPVVQRNVAGINMLVLAIRSASEAPNRPPAEGPGAEAMYTTPGEAWTRGVELEWGQDSEGRSERRRPGALATLSSTSGSSLCECVKPRRRSSATVSALRNATT